jgi:hypothetical protein
MPLLASPESKLRQYADNSVNYAEKRFMKLVTGSFVGNEGKVLKH